MTSTATLAALQPHGEDEHAVQQALQAVDDQQQQVEQRLAAARAARAEALGDPAVTTRQIEDIDKTIHNDDVLLERLIATRILFEERLIEAQIAAQRAVVATAIQEAVAAIAEFRAAFEKYPGLAQRIAEICQLDRKARAAVHSAQLAAATMDGHAVFSVPTVTGGCLSDVVVLPSEVGMFWGQRPPPEPAIRYQ